MKIKILTESELHQCIMITPEVINAIEEGFTSLSQDHVTMPPIMRIEFPEVNGEVDVKSAAVGELDGFAIKVSSGFFDNHKLGLSSLSGMMTLFSAKTGIPQAVLLDNGYLTDVRTGAAGAVAARHLARENVETVGVIGAGAQARYQMIGLKQVRDFKRVLVYSLDGMDAYVEEMPGVLGVDVQPVDGVEAVVRESDIVVTTTPAKKPYLKAEWLHLGLHITAMGADAEEKGELFAESLGRADLLVCDRRSQSFRLGEFHHGLEAGVLTSQNDAVELGEITSGRKAGRTSDEQITICDLTGTGMQDTVIATLAYQKATSQGMGLEIES
ncbi:MAG: cyclodeaminase [Anaerolineales bacterium]